MIEKKLFQYKVFKVNGVRFAIRKLSPSLFLDKDYLAPLAGAVEKDTSNGKSKMSDAELTKISDDFKHKMKDAILSSVVYVKSSIFSKKESVDTVIDKIMEMPELYSYLFSLIVNHTMGVKKNYSHLFKLTGNLRQQLTI